MATKLNFLQYTYRIRNNHKTLYSQHFQVTYMLHKAGYWTTVSTLSILVYMLSRWLWSRKARFCWCHACWIHDNRRTPDGWSYAGTCTCIAASHYNDVIMGTMASIITSLTIVFSTVYSDADQRKHQSSASLAFVRGIHRGPVNSPHKWSVA